MFIVVAIKFPEQNTFAAAVYSYRDTVAPFSPKFMEEDVF